MDTEIGTNQLLWDELVGVHAAAADTYDLAAFRNGTSTLRPLELQEVGEVAGKRLVHLQCHFGLDSLSWARQGAVVTGIDFSPNAIMLVQQLSEDLATPATFVCSDVYDLPHRLTGTFDIVFTSYGVLTWLPDLCRWAAVVRHFLAEDGYFYIAEHHPVGGMIDEIDHQLAIAEPYFNTGPFKDESDGSYADRTAALTNKLPYQWQHPLGDVVSALAAEGLRVEFLHEYPFCTFQRLPSMVKEADGWWRLPGRDDVPLLFSLKAVSTA